MLAEVAAPEIPALAAVLAAAVSFIIYLVALGALHVWRATAGNILNWLADKMDAVSISIPHITSIKPLAPISAAFRAIVHNVDSLIGLVATAHEKAAATLFKFFIGIHVWMARETADLAVDTWHAVMHATTKVTHTTTKVITHTVVKPITKQIVITKGLTQTAYHVLVNRIARVESRVGHLAHEVTHLTSAIGHDVVALPARVGVTAKQMRRAEARLKNLEKKLTGAGAVALVGAVALRLGFKWWKCEAFRNVGKRANCGTWRFLQSLMSLALDTLVITNLCTVTAMLVRISNDVQPVLGRMTTGLTSLMACQGSSLPPNLPLQSAALPPQQTATLNL